MSQGLPKQKFSNLFKAFDASMTEKKYLIHRFKAPGMLTQAVISYNSRSAYVDEPIRISFYLRNPLRNEI